jgi:hypothetical protein
MLFSIKSTLFFLAFDHNLVLDCLFSIKLKLEISTSDFCHTHEVCHSRVWCSSVHSVGGIKLFFCIKAIWSFAMA